MKELREYEQRNQRKRNLQLHQLEVIMNTGLPMTIKLVTRIPLMSDQYESFPSDREAEKTAEVEMDTPPDIAVDTVTTTYHDELMQLHHVHTVELQKELDTANKDKNTWQSMYDKENEDNVAWKKDWDSLYAKNKKLVKKCEELMTLLDQATDPKVIKLPSKKEIKTIDNRSIVKKVESKPGDEPDPFAKVRETRFYGDAGTIKPKGYPAFPKFKGHSLRKGKWIFVKHPLEEHLANDEKPRLNIRSIRPSYSSLTTHEVWQVRRYIKSGRKNNWIEKRLGMTDAASSTMRTGKSYLKVPPEPKMRPVKPTTVHAGEGVITQKKNQSLFD
jgi:hypothetical protein